MNDDAAWNEIAKPSWARVMAPPSRLSWYRNLSKTISWIGPIGLAKIKGVEPIASTTKFNARSIRVSLAINPTATSSDGHPDRSQFVIRLTLTYANCMDRRALHFENLDHAITECEKLAESGYIRNGNWSLGQICSHVRLTMEANMDGYPWWMSLALPLRPVLRSLLLPRLLRGDSPAGIKTAGIFVPPANSIDGDETIAFADCVKRFHSHTGILYPHPGFGRLTKSEFERFHAAHAAHHLGFLGSSELNEHTVG